MSDTDKWYISGPLGIGTADPRKKLHIQGNSSANLLNDDHDRPGLAITGSYPELDMFSAVNNPTHGPTIRMGGYNDDQKNTFKHWVIGTAGRNSTFLDIGFSDKNDPNPHAGIRNYNGKTCLTILDNGNVGIGTTEPVSRLHVADGNSALKFYNLPDITVLSAENSAAASTIVLNLQNPAKAWQLRVAGPDGDKFKIYDATNIADRLTIDGSGNVGIGTTAPTHPLHLKTGWSFVALDTNAAGQDSGIRLMEAGAVKWHIWNSADKANLRIQRAGASFPALAIDQNGNVGIGTAPVSGKLQFDNRAGNKVVVYDNGPTDRYGFGLNNSNLNAFVPAGGHFSIRQNGYDGTEVMTVTGDGNVGIGTTTPQEKLHVSGNIHWVGNQAANSYIYLGNFLICWGLIQISMQSPTWEYLRDITFPLSFAAQPIVTISLNDPGCGRDMADTVVGSLNVTQVAFTACVKRIPLAGYDPKNGSIDVNWIAIGRI